MRVAIDSCPAEWLQHVSSLLLRAEAENNLLLGLAAQAVNDPERFGDGLTLLRIMDGTSVAGAALVNPYNLILSRQSTTALTALANDLADAGIRLPGVLGPDEIPQQFAQMWTERTGVGAELRQNQRIHECRLVESLAAAPGRCRAPVEGDVDTLATWRHAFHVAVNVSSLDDDPAAVVRRMMARNELLIWEDDGTVVSVAATPRRTPHGAVVTFVYTPPEHRSRGFATSCVAELTRANLAAGAEFCCLYTDLANPVSNAIYARIGYRPVCDSGWWRFTESPD